MIYRRTLLIIGILLSSNLLFPQDKLNYIREIQSSWQANWIGPQPNLYSASDKVLDDVDWIWCIEKSLNRVVAPELDTELGKCFFRREFEVLDHSQLRSAKVSLTTDNSFQLYLNGEMIAQNDQWEKVKTIDLLPYLNDGKNCIAIEAENSAYYHEPNRCQSPAGIIAKLVLVDNKGKNQTIPTDRNWRSTLSFYENWQMPGFKDIEWDSTVVLPKKGLASWEGAGSDANQWLCFRKSFNLSQLPQIAMANIAVDSKYWLWLNGELVVFEGGLKRGPTPVDTYFDEVDLKPYCKKGGNTIAILVWYWGRNGYCHKSTDLASRDSCGSIILQCTTHTQLNCRTIYHWDRP
jgi:hypothetical protein